MRRQEYTIDDKKYEDEFIKFFLEQEFLNIINFLESKGMYIQIPTILDGWDATFAYRKICNTNSLPEAKRKLEHLLYMRLSKRDPVWITKDRFQDL